MCNKCFKKLENQAIFKVEKNSSLVKQFEEHLYIFNYEGMIRKILLKYKFQDSPYLYKTFVNFLLKNEKFFQILKSYDTIVPVPISNKRYKKRGYNQSELIAREISKILNLKLEKNCLLKIKNTVEQSSLNKEDRINNAQGVYQLKDTKKITNKKIILVDDIYTTGSTINECCKTLNSAIPQKIGILTIAKDEL